jgi:hypothetical protein
MHKLISTGVSPGTAAVSWQHSRGLCGDSCCWPAPQQRLREFASQLASAAKAPKRAAVTASTCQLGCRIMDSRKFAVSRQPLCEICGKECMHLWALDLLPHSGASCYAHHLTLVIAGNCPGPRARSARGAARFVQLRVVLVLCDLDHYVDHPLTRRNSGQAVTDKRAEGITVLSCF